MKKVIVIVLIVLLVSSLLFVLNNKTNLVGTTYDIPLIESISYRNNNFIINAGNYMYGDINEDGLINELDKLAIDFIIDDNFKYTEGQKILSDLNKDNVIDNKDKKLLINYIDNHKDNDNEYDYYSNIVYCVSDSEDIDNCDYQESNYFYNLDFSKSYHYITVKNKETNKVNTYKYSYE